MGIEQDVGMEVMVGGVVIVPALIVGIVRLLVADVVAAIVVAFVVVFCCVCAAGFVSFYSIWRCSIQKQGWRQQQSVVVFSFVAWPNFAARANT